MKIRMTTYKHFILSKSELEMLKTMEIHRQAECNKHSSCRSCPFNDTYLCHPRFDLRTHERTRRIVYVRNKGDVQK